MFSFLWKSHQKPSPPPKEKPKKHKYFWPNDFGDNSPHYQWLANKTFLQEGFTRIFFNKFDFTDENRFFEIISVLHEQFVFVHCVFTQDQIEKMIKNNFDLSGCTYTLKEPIAFDKYIELYHFCEEKNIKNRLAELPVDCADIDFFQDTRVDIVGTCYPTSLKESRLSTAQLHFLIANRSMMRSLNLSGLIFEAVDISGLIKSAHLFLSFSTLDINTPSVIFLEKSSVHNAVLDIEALAICATNLKFLIWFNQPELKFKICFENDIDGFQDHHIEVTVSDFVKKLEQPCATPRIAQPSNFDLLKQSIKQHRSDLPDLNFLIMSDGEKLLWAFYAAHHLPESDAAKPVWRALGFNRRYSGMQPIKSLTKREPMQLGM